ncbi:hypothetical protein AB0A81_27330 [Streptomyces flaveolus]|uniref:Uncharacterized protein n=1 Tax=Streptomyces flaveolus TaxID=67297 RepID=A0ABV1VBN7_9ACTN
MSGSNKKRGLRGGALAFGVNRAPQGLQLEGQQLAQPVVPQPAER